jgi:hypothetical protein
MGREVTLADPGTNPDGFSPKGPAWVCIQGPPQRQCYEAPDGFGRFPSVEVIEVEKAKPALLFSAASGGVSGWEIHFALLRPGKGKDLDDLFWLDTSVSNLSQHRFWSDPTISPSPIFVTAEYVLGPDESHDGPHRFITSAYILKHSSLPDHVGYYLQDRYMTVRKYDLDANADILTSEKQEILARLKRTLP